MATEQETREMLERVYLPGFMTISGPGDYGDHDAHYRVRPVEPPVTHIVNYLTPRGAHISLSQAGILFVNHLLGSGQIEFNEDLHEATRGSRLRIIEFYHKMRREISLERDVLLELELEKFRGGDLPYVRIGFDFAGRAHKGYLSAVISKIPVPQTNADILRN